MAAVAVQHHERMDGSGYPRGLSGGEISPGGRLLGAADSYHARLEPRPHRARHDTGSGGRRAEGRGARRASRRGCCGRCPRLGGPPGQPPPGVAGRLDGREVEILRLVARVLSNRQIASELTISPKTANAHVEHIYTKLGVNSRALASLFAAKHGLISLEQQS